MGNMKVDMLQVKVKDGSSRKFKCDKCPYQSSQKGNVKTHIMGVHEKIKNHVCNECGFAFFLRHHLKAHNDSVHKKIKNHVCNECGSTFSRKGHL